MKRISFIVGIALLFSFVSGQMGQAEEQIFKRKPISVGQKYVPDEIIVKFKRGVREDVIDRLNARHGAVAFYKSRLAGFKRLRIPARRTVSEMVERYRRDPNVEYAEPNYIAYAFWVPNDDHYSAQWHLNNPEYGGINMEEAWQTEEDLGLEPGGDPSVVVAVLDTGVAYEDRTERERWLWWWVERRYEQAPDLGDTSFVQGYDFVNDDSHPNDDEGHGTHVTGTIAQSTNNGMGVAGVAFNCSIMPVKVLDSSGSGTYADVADGIIWAADQGADIINLSLGGPQASTTLENACAYAYNNGVTIVCAAGNDGQDTVSYPAAYDEYCIAVGATDYYENRAYYSNYGESLDLVAPGGDIGQTIRDENGDSYPAGVLQQTFGNSTTDWGYWFYEGTSMAAPHVSGVAALLISLLRSNEMEMTPQQVRDEVREALESSAEYLLGEQHENVWDREYGWGVVDAAAALNYVAEPPTEPSVRTFDAENVTETSATLKGHLTLGIAESLDVSFEYRTPSGEYNHETDPVPMTESGAFSADVIELSPNTIYYFSAKAEGDGTTYYGEEMSFTTTGPAPTTPTAHISIDIFRQSFWFIWWATATITIREGDASGPPLEGVTVAGDWSGAYNGSVSGTTNGSGQVSFGTPLMVGGGGVCFTVDSVGKDGQEHELAGEIDDCR